MHYALYLWFLSFFSIQSKFNERMELLNMKPNLVKPGETVQRACYAGFPHNLVVTDHSLFLVDQRFAAHPVSIAIICS